MSYHYAKRLDKNRNLLLTSYTNAKSAEKYGGADAEVTETLFYANFSEDHRQLSIDESRNDLVVRSYLRNAQAPQASANGVYRLWGKINGVWSETDFSFDSYGAANTLMKAVVVGYEAMLVVEETGENKPKPARGGESMDMSSL